jgi:predicted naringenin-chalcone synthase
LWGEVHELRVVGAGYARTGTLSLKAALETLGVEPCLHPMSAPAAEQVLALARAEAEPREWEAALNEWHAALGWVGARHYRELIEAWPQALVLLSVRDPEDWYVSYASCLRATRELALAGGHALDSDDAVASSALMMLDGATLEGVLDGSYSQRDEALERYARHNKQVLETVPADRLLVYDVEDGWEPLCEFLGVDVPDVPFPHLNDRREFRAHFERRAAFARRPSPRQARQVRIGSIALADHGRTFTQSEALAALGMAGDPFAERIFASCGVKQRHLAMLEGAEARTVQGRTSRAENVLLARSIRAVDALGVDLSEIDTIITSSLYALGAPTLAHRLVEHYDLDPATDKYHVAGAGCASAVPLIRLMARTIDDAPGRKGLIVAAESMSALLSEATSEDPRAKVIGAAIFGDGCAAMTIEASENASGPAVVASTVHQIPGTIDIVHMEVEDDDNYLYLSRDLPDVAAAGLADLVESFLAPLGLTRYAIDHWIIHPGGRRILECIQEALELADSDVAISYDLLASHGNVGTPSIFYVLAETLERRNPTPGDRGLMITVGPGVTVGLMLLSW